MKRYATQLLLTLATVFAMQAEAPAGYYSASEGKKGKALLTSLFNTISNHHNVGYDGLWNVYRTSDVYPDGTIWDMYSTKHWPVGSKCGNYSAVGDCYNREHSMPKSWFSEASPMKSDAFHVYPTDGKVNGQRSNYPYGECSGGTTLSASGGIKALGRLGTSTFPGYSGRVFEPADEYKGDFARTYFYMAACYNDRISTFNSDMMAHNDYPVYKEWAVNLLLKWHRQDPVSDKERKRNDAVYAKQNNRNPFIDHPDLAEHIWGDKMSTPWSSKGEVATSISSPVSGAVINLGNSAVNAPMTATVTVKGVNLKSDATVTIAGDSRFTTSTPTLKASAVNTDAGAELSITFLSSVEGEGRATVTVSSGDVKTQFTVTARAYSSLTATEATEVGDESFVANWVNIDGPSARYDLYVMFNGSVLSGYPVNVAAADGHYLVTGLNPSTTYTYHVESPRLQSNVISVTTLEPIPSVQFLFDGDLAFYTVPGQASDIAELLAVIDNIADDVNVSVTAPFEVSTDRSKWSTSVVLKPGEDRFYMRLGVAPVGTYSTSIVASTASGYHNDDAEVTGEVAETVTFMEIFPAKAESYNTTAYEGSMGPWTFSNVGVWPTDALPSGHNTARFGKNSDSSITMAFDKPRGAGQVTFVAQAWSDRDGDATLVIEYSKDGGNQWTPASSVTVPYSAMTDFSVPVNQAGDIRLRLRQTAGARLNIGDIAISDYTLSGLEASLDYHAWDAFCRDGKLIVESSAEAIDVDVYDMQGITRYHGSDVAAGTLSIDLPAGLYIVVVNDFARRVVVK